MNIRKELCKKYTVHSIVKLPLETFGSSRINTYALILLNSCEQGEQDAYLKTMIKRGNTLRIEQDTVISSERMKSGEWMGVVSKEKKSVRIFRGNISSEKFSLEGECVYHNSSIVTKVGWVPSIRHCSQPDIIRNAKCAERGDVLINRVGKYANYWCICQKDGIVSDCLLVVKTSKNKDIIHKLQKNSVDGKLNLKEKGVATKYTTAEDVLSLL